MKKWMSFVIALCAAMMIAVCAAAEMAKVANPDPTDRLNLRTKPTEEAITLGKYYNGVVVIVQNVKNGWAKVDVQGREGYMKNEFLSYDVDYGAIDEKTSAVPTMTVNVPTLNLREDTSTTSKIIKTYPAGTQVQVIGVGTVWHHVFAPGDNGGNFVGYMKAEYLDGDVSFHKYEETEAVRAIVANPDPNDRLNLRAAPSEEAVSLGKFYNWTPVNVLEKRADGWCRVEIGEEGCGKASGYMKTAYLAFGAEMDLVDSGIEIHEVAHDAVIEEVPGGADECVRAMKKGEVLYVLGDIGEEYCFVMTRSLTGYFPRWALSKDAI